MHVNLSVEFEEELCCLDCRNYAIYMHALSETRARNAQLAFLTTDIFASFGVLPLLHLIPVVICILVILLFQQ